MPTPKGGRGLANPWTSKAKHIPRPLEPVIDQLIERFRESGGQLTDKLLSSFDGDENLSENKPLIGLDSAIAKLRHLPKQGKFSKRYLEEILSTIYGVDVTL